MIVPRVKAGQRQRLSAAAFNAMAEAAEAARGARLGTTGRPPQSATPGVWVRNATEEPLRVFDVVGLAGAVYEPGRSDSAFEARIVLNAVQPTAAHVQRFGVLRQGIGPNGMCLATVVGVTVARVMTDGGAHSRGAIVPGQRYLQLGGDGPAAVLWAPDVVGATLAVVALSPAGSGGAIEQAFVDATVNDTHLLVRRVDANEQPIGDPFTVATYRYPPDPLSQCTPRVVGFRVPIAVVGGEYRCLAPFIGGCDQPQEAP